MENYSGEWRGLTRRINWKKLSENILFNLNLLATDFNAVKPAFYILTVWVIASCSEQNNSDLTAQKLQLKQIFTDWQKNEVATGHFWAPDSCNPEWFVDHQFDGMIDDMWGLPDSSEYSYSYSD